MRVQFITPLVGFCWLICIKETHFSSAEINECSQVPPACGPNASCLKNARSFSCKCLPGYRSSKGDSWLPGSVAPLNCSDIDECSQVPSVCGLHNSCVNTPGSYNCQCQPGYSPPRGNSWKPGDSHSLNCTDIDECSQVPSVCGLHSFCINTLGNYSCQCKAGHSSPGGNSWKPGDNHTLNCTDIDECSENPSICGLHSFCINTPASYSCQCNAGYSSPGGNSCKHGGNHTLNCTENTIGDQFKNLTGVTLESRCNTSQNGNQENNPFCILIEGILKTRSSAFENGSNPESLQKATASFESFVGNINELSPKEKVLAATVFLKSVESVAFQAALASPTNQLEPNKNEAITIAAKAVKDNCRSQGERISLNAKNELMAIDCTTVVGSDGSGTGAVVFIVYDQLESVLKDSVSDQSLTGADRLDEVTLNSNVVSVTVGERRNLSRPFNFTLEHKQVASLQRGLFSSFHLLPYPTRNPNLNAASDPKI
nr:adhesion G protein-coupled receptor E1-like [Pelodiscus sinensis]|eukprot:XP_025036037.1 adhesion G protein-coupled receptor E1-like [Pelodiscus sinensis]